MYIYISRKTQLEVTEHQKKLIDDNIYFRHRIWNTLVEVYNPIIDRNKKLPLQKDVEFFLSRIFRNCKSRIRRSTILDYFEAWKLCWTIKTHGQPKFHSIRSANGYNVVDGGTKIANNTFSLHGHILKNLIKFHEDMSMYNNVFVTAYSIQHRNNKYYITFTFKYKKDSFDYEDNFDGEIGLDFGLGHIFTDSNNEAYDIPDSLIRQEMRIRKLQSIMDKKQKGSKNRDRMKSKLNSAWFRYDNIKKDWIEKFTYKLCKDNKLIALEDLSIEEMLMNGNKSRRRMFNRYSFYAIKTRFQQKSQRFKDCNVVLVDRYFPSSQLCSSCGTIHEEMKDFKNHRQMVCDCGNNVDRDYNAAINILKEAQRTCCASI